MSRNSHRKYEQNKHSVQSNTAHVVKSHEDYQAHTWGDTLIVLLIIGLGIIFILPFYSVMPAGARYAAMIVFAITIVLFAGSLWNKKPADMAVTHPQTAGHLVYLATIVILACVIVLQLLSGQLDFWLVVILVVVILARSLLVMLHKDA